MGGVQRSLRVGGALMIALLSLSLAADVGVTSLLRDADGSLVDGPTDLDVVVYDSSSGSNVVYQRAFSGHDVNAGLVRLTVPEADADAWPSTPLFVEIQASGVVVGARQPVGHVAQVAAAETWRGHKVITLDGSYRTWSDGSLASSCVDYLHPEAGALYLGDTGDGVYRIDLNGSPTDVWCDMTTAGGGWMLVWKNGGGLYPNTASNADLIANPAAAIVEPPDVTTGSEMHAALFAAYWDAPEREWMKRVWLWDSSGTLEADSWFRMEMGATSMDDIFSHVQTSDQECYQVPSRISVFYEGGFAGATDYLFRWTISAQSFGFASDVNNGVNGDMCGQTSDNYISTSGLRGNGNAFNWRHALSYVHDHSSTSRSRCFHYCWNATTVTQFSEAFVVGVR